MGLLRRLFASFELTPTFAELRQQNHDAAANYPRERVVAELLARVAHDPRARAELHTLLQAPLDAAARARCCTLLGYDRPGMSRPGNIEEFWYLDGLLDRLRALDERA